MRFTDINKSMNYLTKRYGSSDKNIAVNLIGLISFVNTANISSEEKDRAIDYIQDQIKYGLNLTDEQKSILLNETNKEEVKEEVRSFRI